MAIIQPDVDFRVSRHPPQSASAEAPENGMTIFPNEGTSEHN